MGNACSDGCFGMLGSKKVSQLRACKQDLKKFIDGKNCHPIMVRLAWHDSGTYDQRIKNFPERGGANGAIRFAGEMNFGANAGLDKAKGFLDEFAKKYPEISWADLIQLASAVAIECAGGPAIDMKYGRVAVTSDSECVKSGSREGFSGNAGLPDAKPPFGCGAPTAAQHLRNVFTKKMGFTDQEIVALSGAHTIGRAFKERSGACPFGYGEQGASKYTKSDCLARKDGQKGVGMVGGAAWTKNWLTFDNSYFKDYKLASEDQDLLWFPTDEALHTDPEFKKYFDIYAKDQDAFFKDYAKAHKKLSELGAKFVLPDLPPSVDMVVAAYNADMMGKVGAAKIAFVAPDEWEKGEDLRCPKDTPPEKRLGHLLRASQSGEGLSTEYVIREVLLGVTICFAQIPESVAFAFMANIKPPIALHAAWIVGFICSAFGGRPGMVNGATGAFAAIIGTFIPPAGTGNNGEGVELLFPSVILAGLLMVLVSVTKLSRFITLRSFEVMLGFCNGLAIVIGLSQLHPFEDPVTHHWKEGMEMIWMLVICFSSMIVMEFLPKIPLKIFKVVPSSLLAIISAIVIEFAIVRSSGSRTATIRDVSEFTLDTAFPIPFFISTDAVSYDLTPILTGDGISKIVIQASWLRRRLADPLGFLCSYARHVGIFLCLVGSIESLMTAEEPGNGDRTVLAMGAANVLSGFLGGMGGNAMIGLSTVNCLNGGKGRLGPCVTALGIMACVMGAYPLLNYIPVAALAGIMLVVVLHTFKWFTIPMVLAAFLPKSLREKLGLQRKVPRIDAIVIIIVTILCKWPAGTNIAVAVGVGVAICSVSYAWNSADTFEVIVSEKEDVKQYFIHGPFFFTSANRFLKILNADEDPEKVEVVFSEATSLFDYSAMQAMNKVSAEYKSKGKQIVFKSLCSKSTKLINKAGLLRSETEYTERDMEVADLHGVEWGGGDLPEGGELGHALSRYGLPSLHPENGSRNGTKDSPAQVVSANDLTVVVGNVNEAANVLKAGKLWVFAAEGAASLAASMEAALFQSVLIPAAYHTTIHSQASTANTTNPGSALDSLQPQQHVINTVHYIIKPSSEVVGVRGGVCCNGDRSTRDRDAGAIAARWAALWGTKLRGCKLLGHPCGVVLLLLIARRSETACNPEDLQHVKPPYGGNLLPSYFILSQHLNLSRAETIVNVYDKHWARLGHFYRDIYGHFGYSDLSNRIWFEARRSMMNNMFRSRVLPRQFNLQKCNVDFDGQRGGIFDVSEAFQGDVHHVANAIFSLDYSKNLTLGIGQFHKWQTLDGWLHHRPREATRLFGRRALRDLDLKLDGGRLRVFAAAKLGCWLPSRF
ncbi:APX8 [Symbiodinium sp. CCMP2456]|nr:APX8 [Symbiodinium sp. CCMP2456]